MARTRRSAVLKDLRGLVDLRTLVGRLLTLPLPDGVALRFRAELLRFAGLRIGHRTLIASSLRLFGAGASRNLVIGSDCFINVDCVFDATASIEIGDRVSLGQGVIITTSGHAFDAPWRRAGALQPLPVKIGNGAWLAARVTVLPGTTIGEGAVVAAGSVVTGEVAPNMLVGGIPARPIRSMQ